MTAKRERGLNGRYSGFVKMGKSGVHTSEQNKKSFVIKGNRIGSKRNFNKD